VVVLEKGRPGLILIELVKQTRRARVWVTLAVMAIVPLLLTAVIGSTRPAVAERIGDWGSVVTNTSGFTMPLIALTAMQLFLIPLGVTILAAEAVAGERSWGSLRYLLARPVSRSRVLLSKTAVAAAFALAVVLVATTASLAGGVLAFGWRPLTVLDLQHTSAFFIATTTLNPAAALARVWLATGLVACSMAGTFAFTLFLSTLTDRPFGAVAGGIGLGLVSRALDNIPGLHALGPWLPMTDAGTTAWTALFMQPVDLSGVAHLALVQAVYSAAFLAAAWIRFSRADVLG
jgi:ABC-2 type transport system permease protein